MRLLTLVLTLLAFSPLARSEDASLGFMDYPHFYFGDCKLPTDPAVSSLWLLTCIEGAAGVEAMSGMEEADNRLSYFGSGYFGFHLNQLFSIHGQGEARGRRSLARSEAVADSRDVEYLMLRIGNPATDRLRTQVGQVRLPFGIDQSATMTVLEPYEDRSFWAAEKYGVVLTYDNLRDVQFDLGATTNEDFLAKNKDQMDEPIEQTYAGRLMVDFSSLEQARLLLSLASRRDRHKRLGAAFVSRGKSGGITFLEFVRVSETTRWNLDLDQQLIRFSHVGRRVAGAQWMIQFDDLAKLRRIGTLGFDRLFWNHLIFRLSASYVWELSDVDLRERRWLFAAGLSLTL